MKTLFLSQNKGLNMPETINVTVRLDNEIKYNDFVREASLRLSMRSFEIFEKYDPFYNEENQAKLARSIADAEAGRATVHELIEEP